MRLSKLEFFLTNTLTLYPLLKASLVIAEPKNPFAPVIKIFLDILIYLVFNLGYKSIWVNVYSIYI